MQILLSVLLLTAINTTAQQPVTQLQLRQPYQPQYTIKTIRIKHGNLIIIPANTKYLSIGGNYTFSAGANTITGHPTNLFRTGSSLTHSVTLQAAIKRSYAKPLWAFSLKAGKTDETIVIPYNHNTDNNLAVSAERYLGPLSLSAGYSYFFSRFSNDNSTGFLNRAYQNALLTPDDPWALLRNNGHFANRTQQTGQITLQKKQGNVNFGIVNALDAVYANSNTSLQPGSPFYPAGLIYTRNQNDDHYSSNGFLSYRINFPNVNLSSTARLNDIFNDENAGINYPAESYYYHRSSNDAALTLNADYNGPYVNAGLTAGDKSYTSNTSLHHPFYLPEVNGYLSSDNFFNYHLNVKLAASYTTFRSETPLNTSFSYFMLTQLTPQDASRFAPTTEIKTFNNLSPMEHREFTSWIQLDYMYTVNLRAEYSVRNTKDNVYPDYGNNQLTLINLADTRYKGLELQLQVNSRYQRPNYLFVRNSMSLYTYSNIVTRMEDGYDIHPIAGFSTIYKALVKGQPVGVIMTSAPTAIIGNPTPAYTLKFSHQATWKDLNFNVDWEYRKGGDIWNGTRMTHDYDAPGATIGAPSAYIQKADNIRIHNLSFAYDLKAKKYLQRIRLTAYAENLILWSAYKGVDPNQLLYDQPASAGLDFFNLPSTKTYGISTSFQF